MFVFYLLFFLIYLMLVIFLIGRDLSLIDGLDFLVGCNDSQIGGLRVRWCLWASIMR